MKHVSVGILGFGTVGAGVADCLLKNRGLICERTGVDVELTGIGDLDTTTDRGVAVPPGLLTSDTPSVIAKSDIVVELIGGTTVSRKFILSALEQGKTVVTANKALLADYGREIFDAAEAGGGTVFYEASVAGGIPIIKSLREGFVGNRINRIFGILNGTCNYIFTRMERENLGFEEVLKDAQRLGYAEANPSLDIDGFDTAHKAVILASLAYGGWHSTNEIYVQGIRDVSLSDIRCADELGYKIKLLAIIKQCADSRIEVRVHPTLIPKHAPLAGISDVFNGVMVNGDFVGDTLFYGRGAGRAATASAVVSDIADAALNLASGAPVRIPAYRKAVECAGIVPMEEITSRYYLRLTVTDRPGVLAKLAGILAEQGVSVSRLMQNPVSKTAAGEASIVIITHEAKESAVRQAITAMDSFDAVHGKICLLRIEEL